MNIEETLREFKYMYDPNEEEYEFVKNNLERLMASSYLQGFTLGYEKCSEDFKKFHPFTHAKKSEMDGYA
jgi:hypothetical protein